MCGPLTHIWGDYSGHHINTFPEKLVEWSGVKCLVRRTRKGAGCVVKNAFFIEYGVEMQGRHKKAPCLGIECA